MNRLQFRLENWRHAAVMAGVAVLTVLAVFFFPAAVFAEEDVITIGSTEELARIGVEEGYPNNGNYELEIDIDLGTYDNWEPLPDFSGTFDGKGHKISGLKIQASSNYAGLFQRNFGTIKNLYIEAEEIVNDGNYTGVLTGDNFLGRVENVHVLSGSVTGKNDTGGLVGHNSGTIVHSSSAAQVMGDTRVGGLVGKNRGAIDASHAAGNVTGHIRTGGLAGESSKSITNSYALGDVKSAQGYAGGLVGYMQPETTSEVITIFSSYATGNVTVESSGWDSDAGGLVGRATGKVGIQNSFASGTVTGAGYWVGGLAGTLIAASEFTLEVQDSFATGDVQGTYGVGGLVGTATATTFTRSYATGTVSGQEHVGGLVGVFTGPTATRNRIFDSFTLGHVQGNKYVGGIAGSIDQSKLERVFTMGNMVRLGSDPTNIGNIVGTLTTGILVFDAYYSGSGGSINAGKKLTVAQMTQPEMLRGFQFVSASDLTKTWMIIPGVNHPVLLNPYVPQPVIEQDDSVPSKVRYGESLNFSGLVRLEMRGDEANFPDRVKPLHVFVKLTTESGQQLAVVPLATFTNPEAEQTFEQTVVIDGTFPGEGTYRYELWAATMRGGVAVQTGTFEIEAVADIDIEVEKGDGSGYQPGEWTQEAVIRASFGWDDPASRQYAVTDSVTEHPETLTGWQSYTGPVTVRDTGEWVVYIRTKHQYANKWFYQYVQVRVDQTEPAAPSFVLSGTEGGGGWYTSDVTIQLVGDDEHSGVARIEYQIVQGTEAGPSADGWQEYKDESRPKITDEGIWTVYARATDKVGNIGNVSQETVKVDKTPPAKPNIEADGLNAEGWAKDAVSITITAGEPDEHSGDGVLQYRIGEAGAWTTYDPKEGVEVEEEGVTTVYARMVDKAGNEGEAASAQVKIDKTAPGVTAIQLSGTAGENGWHKSDVTIELEGEDQGAIANRSGVARIEYQIVQGTEAGPRADGWQEYKDESRPKIEASGVWTVYARVTDKAGNISSVSQETVKVDKTPPAKPNIEADGLNAEGWAKDAVSITITAGEPDEHSGDGVLEYRIGEAGAWTTYDPDEGVKVEEEGITTVYARMVDKAGNEGEAASLQVRIDKTAPGAPAIQLSGTAGENGWHKSDVTIEIEGEDQGDENSRSGVGRIEYQIVQGNEASPDVNGWQEYRTDAASLPKITDEGIWTVYARATDKAGNTGSVSSKTVKVDKTTPAEPVIQLSAYDWTNRPVTVTIIAGTDNLSGQDKVMVEYKRGTEGWTPYTGPFEIPVTEEGETTIYARTKDETGHESQTVQAVVKIDNTKPEKPEFDVEGTVGEGGWYTSSVTVTFSATDPVGEVDYYKYSINGQAEAFTAGTIVFTEEGEYEIVAVAVDMAGNESDPATLTVKIDLTPPGAPHIDLSGVNQNGWATGNVTVTVTEAVYTVGGVVYSEYRIGDSGPWEIYTGPFEVGGEGIHPVYARTVDTAGYQGAESVRYVKIDLTKPEKPFIQLNGQLGKDGWVRAVTVEMAPGADELSGPDYVEYRIGDTGQWIRYTHRLEETEFMAEGTYVLYARTVDKAGNVSDEASVEFKVDLTQPDAPQMVLTGPDAPVGPDTWRTGPVQVELAGGDDLLSGLDDYEYKINNGPWTRYTGPFEISDGYETKVYARAVDKAGNVSAETVKTVVIESNRPAPPSGGDDEETIPVTPPAPGGSSGEASRTVQTVTVDAEQVREQLAKEGSGAVVTIHEETDAVTVELSGQIVHDMALAQAVIEVNTGHASYRLPAALIDEAEIREQFGADVNLDEISVRISVVESTEEEVRFAEAIAAGYGAAVIVPPVHFTVEAEYAGRTLQWTGFGGFVERRIAIPEGIDPQQVTTAAVVDEDGTMRHVPTKVVLVDGRYYAVIYSMTNSLYALVNKTAAFPDMAKHWAEAAVKDMGSRLIVFGRDNGQYEPDGKVTRAEFAAMLVRGLGLKAGPGEVPFTDVKAGDWYYEAVKAAYQYGLVQGYEDGRFRPNERITREQAVVMLRKAMALTGLNPQTPEGTLGAYQDAQEVAAWAQGAMADSIAAGLVSGRDGSNLAPKELLTRAETAVLIRNLLQRSGFTMMVSEF
jgi:hypothetical protein